MNRRYRVRYELPDEYYGCVEISCETPKQAQQRAEEYLRAKGILYLQIDDVYEVDLQK